MCEETKEKGYLIYLRPFNSGERYDDAALKFGEKSVEKGIAGLGWGIEEIEKPEKEMILKDRIEEIKSKINRRSGKWKAIRTIDKVAKDDFFITRLQDNNCYIGKVKREAYHRTYARENYPFKDFCRYSWIVKVDWKIGPIAFHKLPSAIQGMMSSKYNGTINELGDLHTHILKRMYEGKSVGKYELNIDNFHEALSAEDLENLVAYHMKNKHKSYFLVPSTCKKDYPLYEFVMVDSKNDKRVTCQVKNTDTVDAKKYKSDFFERIYLFSGNEEYGDEDPADNMEIIQRKDLFGIIRQQFKEKQGFFYNELKDYYEIQL